jgi:4'-phosphopantetheinyl transferase
LTILILNKDNLSSSFTIEKMTSLLPASIIERGLRYKNEGAQRNFFLGRLLLRKVLIDCKIGEAELENISYSENDKPTIDGLHFSITHSGNYVAIAYSLSIEVGLDIQTFTKVDTNLFKKWFNEVEWNDIVSNEDPKHQFYNYWVAKECILKLKDLTLASVPDILIQDLILGQLSNQVNTYHLFYFNQYLENASGAFATEIPLTNPVISTINESHLF